MPGSPSPFPTTRDSNTAGANLRRDLFCQHVAGYAGRDTTRRGPAVADEAVWTVGQLQELFDEWVVACWQNRPHEGLSHTWGEGQDLSPNEMFAACVGISGYVPLPLTGNDYIELLPVVFRTVNDYGLTINRPAALVHLAR
jgi:hypothetical protein